MGLAVVRGYHSAQRTLSLRYFFRDQMSYLRRLRAEMKCLGAPLDFAILGGDPFVLSQMISPRFSHKTLDVSLRVRSVNVLLVLAGFALIVLKAMLHRMR
jgi:hypothetical protein